jgi:putative transposase
MNKYITELKSERLEFSDVHSQVLQNISKRVSDGYKAFFKRVKEKKKGKKTKVGFPRYKKFVCSFTYPQTGFRFKNQRRVYLSGIGSIPIVLHRLPKGETKTCTIKRYRSKKWYVSFSNEVPAEDFRSNGKEEVGIDVGLKSFATLSNGQKVEPPKFLRKSEERLKLLQRRVSRKKLKSRNRKKANFRLSRLHEKIDNQRTDFLHKLSKEQVTSFSKIAVEKLKLQNMMSNHHLAKSIADASWGGYIQMLHYKAWSAGCEVEEVAPENTTKTCSNCGNKQDMPLSERTYKCPFCGYIEDRDINAAKNILKRATVGLTGSYACGDTASTLSAKDEQAVSLKQELNEART